MVLEVIPQCKNACLGFYLKEVLVARNISIVIRNNLVVFVTEEVFVLYNTPYYYIVWKVLCLLTQPSQCYVCIAHG